MKKTEVSDITTALILVLIGGVITVFFVIFIQVRAAVDNAEICKEFWAQKDSNSKVYKNYTPEPRVCKREK